MPMPPIKTLQQIEEERLRAQRQAERDRIAREKAAAEAAAKKAAADKAAQDKIDADRRAKEQATLDASARRGAATKSIERRGGPSAAKQLILPKKPSPYDAPDYKLNAYRYAFSGKRPEEMNYVEKAAVGRLSGKQPGDEYWAQLATEINSPGSVNFNPYFDKATVDEASAFFGRDSFDREWLDQNVGLRNYEQRTDYEDSLSRAGSKKWTQEQWAGYLYNQVLMAEERTAQAEGQWSNMVTNLQDYFNTKLKATGKVPSIEEFIGSIDYSDYPMLQQIDESRNLGLSGSSKPLNFNRAIMYSKENLYGLYRALRTGRPVDAAHNYYEDAVEYFSTPEAKATQKASTKSPSATYNWPVDVSTATPSQIAALEQDIKASGDREEFAELQKASNPNYQDYGVPAFITTEWINTNLPKWQDIIKSKVEYDVNGQGNFPKPSKNAPESEKAAYAVWKASQLEPDTQKVEKQWLAALDELSDLYETWGDYEGITDEDILGKINWNKYKELEDFMEGTGKVDINRPVFASQEALQGALDRLKTLPEGRTLEFTLDKDYALPDAAAKKPQGRTGTEQFGPAKPLTPMEQAEKANQNVLDVFGAIKNKAGEIVGALPGAIRGLQDKLNSVGVEEYDPQRTDFDFAAVPESMWPSLVDKGIITQTQINEFKASQPEESTGMVSAGAKAQSDTTGVSKDELVATLREVQRTIAANQDFDPTDKPNPVVFEHEDKMRALSQQESELIDALKQMGMSDEDIKAALSVQVYTDTGENVTAEALRQQEIDEIKAKIVELRSDMPSNPAALKKREAEIQGLFERLAELDPQPEAVPQGDGPMISAAPEGEKTYEIKTWRAPKNLEDFNAGLRDNFNDLMGAMLENPTLYDAIKSASENDAKVISGETPLGEFEMALNQFVARVVPVDAPQPIRDALVYSAVAGLAVTERTVAAADTILIDTYDVIANSYALHNRDNYVAQLGEDYTLEQARAIDPTLDAFMKVSEDWKKGGDEMLRKDYSKQLGDASLTLLDMYEFGMNQALMTGIGKGLGAGIGAATKGATNIVTKVFPGLDQLPKTLSRIGGVVGKSAGWVAKNMHYELRAYNSYIEEARAMGKSEEDSHLYGVFGMFTNGLVEGYLGGRYEKMLEYGGKFLAKSAVPAVANKFAASGKPIIDFLGNLLKTAAGEGVEEASETFIAAAGQAAILGERPDWNAKVGEAWESAKQGFAGSLASSIFLGMSGLLGEMGTPRYAEHIYEKISKDPEFSAHLEEAMLMKAQKAAVTPPAPAAAAPASAVDKSTAKPAEPATKAPAKPETVEKSEPAPEPKAEPVPKPEQPAPEAPAEEGDVAEAYDASWREGDETGIDEWHASRGDVKETLVSPEAKAIVEFMDHIEPKIEEAAIEAEVEHQVQQEEAAGAFDDLKSLTNARFKAMHTANRVVSEAQAAADEVAAQVQESAATLDRMVRAAVNILSPTESGPVKQGVLNLRSTRAALESDLGELQKKLEKAIAELNDARDTHLAELNQARDARKAELSADLVTQLNEMTMARAAEAQKFAERVQAAIRYSASPTYIHDMYAAYLLNLGRLDDETSEEHMAWYESHEEAGSGQSSQKPDDPDSWTQMHMDKDQDIEADTRRRDKTSVDEKVAAKRGDINTGAPVHPVTGMPMIEVPEKVFKALKAKFTENTIFGVDDGKTFGTEFVTRLNRGAAALARKAANEFARIYGSIRSATTGESTEAAINAETLGESMPKKRVVQSLPGKPGANKKGLLSPAQRLTASKSQLESGRRNPEVLPPHLKKFKSEGFSVVGSNKDFYVLENKNYFKESAEALGRIEALERARDSEVKAGDDADMEFAIVLDETAGMARDGLPSRYYVVVANPPETTTPEMDDIVVHRTDSLDDAIETVRGSKTNPYIPAVGEVAYFVSSDVLAMFNDKYARILEEDKQKMSFEEYSKMAGKMVDEFASENGLSDIERNRMYGAISLFTKAGKPGWATVDHNQDYVLFMKEKHAPRDKVNHGVNSIDDAISIMSTIVEMQRKHREDTDDNGNWMNDQYHDPKRMNAKAPFGEEKNAKPAYSLEGDITWTENLMKDGKVVGKVVRKLGEPIPGSRSSKPESSGVGVVSMRKGAKRESGHTFIRIDRGSVLGNPFKMSNESERAEVIRKYKEYFYNKVESNDPEFIAALDDVVKKAKEGPIDLGCWCAPRACHGDVIQEYVQNKLKAEGAEPISHSGGEPVYERRFATVEEILSRAITIDVNEYIGGTPYHFALEQNVGQDKYGIYDYENKLAERANAERGENESLAVGNLAREVRAWAELAANPDIEPFARQKFLLNFLKAAEQAAEKQREDISDKFKNQSYNTIQHLDKVREYIYLGQYITDIQNTRRQIVDAAMGIGEKLGEGVTAFYASLRNINPIEAQITYDGFEEDMSRLDIIGKALVTKPEAAKGPGATEAVGKDLRPKSFAELQKLMVEYSGIRNRINNALAQARVKVGGGQLLAYYNDLIGQVSDQIAEIEANEAADEITKIATLDTLRETLDHYTRIRDDMVRRGVTPESPSQLVPQDDDFQYNLAAMPHSKLVRLREQTRAKLEAEQKKAMRTAQKNPEKIAALEKLAADIQAEIERGGSKEALAATDKRIQAIRDEAEVARKRDQERKETTLASRVTSIQVPNPRAEVRNVSSVRDSALELLEDTYGIARDDLDTPLARYILPRFLKESREDSMAYQMAGEEMPQELADSYLEAENILVAFADGLDPFAEAPKQTEVSESDSPGDDANGPEPDSRLSPILDTIDNAEVDEGTKAEARAVVQDVTEALTRPVNTPESLEADRDEDIAEAVISEAEKEEQTPVAVEEALPSPAEEQTEVQSSAEPVFAVASEAVPTQAPDPARQGFLNMLRERYRKKNAPKEFPGHYGDIPANATPGSEGANPYTTRIKPPRSEPVLDKGILSDPLSVVPFKPKNDAEYLALAQLRRRAGKQIVELNRNIKRIIDQLNKKELSTSARAQLESNRDSYIGRRDALRNWNRKLSEFIDTDDVKTTSEIANAVEEAALYGVDAPERLKNFKQELLGGKDIIDRADGLLVAVPRPELLKMERSSVLWSVFGNRGGTDLAKNLEIANAITKEMHKVGDRIDGIKAEIDEINDWMLGASREAEMRHRANRDYLNERLEEFSARLANLEAAQMAYYADSSPNAMEALFSRFEGGRIPTSVGIKIGQLILHAFDNTDRTKFMEVLRSAGDTLNVAIDPNNKRVMEGFVGKYAPILNAITFDQVADANTRIAESADKYYEMVRNSGITAENSEVAHQYAEGIIKKAELMRLRPNDHQQIVEGIKVFRRMYDELIDEINDTLVRNGYPPVEKRKNYFPHFKEGGNAILAMLGFEESEYNLPLSIAGKTGEFRPLKTWFGNLLPRTGNETDYGLIEGAARYIPGALQVIHQLDNVSRFRQIEEIIGAIDATDVSKLSTFNQERLKAFKIWMKDQADALAGKKTGLDRWASDRPGGRNTLAVLNKIKTNVGLSLTTFNPGVVLAQGVSLGMAAANAPLHFAVAMSEVMQSVKDPAHFNFGGIEEISKLLSRKYKGKPIPLTTYDRIIATGHIPTELFERFCSNVFVRAIYLQGLDKGYSPEQAIAYADELAARALSIKGRGESAPQYSNAVEGIALQFGREAMNNVMYMLKDMPKAHPKRLKSLGGIVILMLFNWMYNAITGKKTAFDPIGAGVKSIAGREEDESTAQTIWNFVQGTADSGWPLSADLNSGFSNTPVVSKVSDVTSFIGDGLGGNLDFNAPNTLERMASIGLGFVPAGAQIERMYRGGKSFIRGYSESQKGNVRYPVARTPENLITGLTLGVSSTSEGKAYTARGGKPFSASQDQKYLAQVNAGVDTTEAYNNVLNYDEAIRATRDAQKLYNTGDREGGVKAMEEARKMRRAITIPTDMPEWAVKLAASGDRTMKIVIRAWHNSDIPELLPKRTENAVQQTIDGVTMRVDVTDENRADFEDIYQRFFRARMKRLDMASTPKEIKAAMTEAEVQAKREFLLKYWNRR